jgi:hypothetical protein
MERTELVSGEMGVTILHSSQKSGDRGENDAGTERDRQRIRERQREETCKARRKLGKTRSSDK